MPKARTTPADSAPETHLEASADAAPKAPKKKLRAAAGAASFGYFGAAPKGATHWGVRRHRPDGTLERVGGPSPDGSMVVYEWPLAELDDSIATRLDGGKYKLEWIGQGPGGARTHLKWGREFVVPGARTAPIASSPATSSSPAPSGSSDALDALRSIRALVREEREMLDQGVSHQLAALAQLAAVMRPTAPAVAPELAQAIGSIGAVLQRLEGRIDALEGGEEEDEEEEEEDEEPEEGAEASGEIFRPNGEGHGDVAIAAGLNKLATFLDGVSPAAAELAGAWLEEKAAEMRRLRAARETLEAKSLNGHAPSASSASSPLEGASEAVG
jgi:hypothetical protein